MIRDVAQYTGVEDALDQVIGKLRGKRRAILIHTRESHGLSAAEDLVSPVPVPPFAVSHMDGFAVRSSDLVKATESEPVTLRVTGDSKLGGHVRISIERGQAVRVVTGSMVPTGADAVVPVENARREGQRLLVRYAPEAGAFIYEKGDDVHKGDVVLSKGKTIRAQDIALLLTIGLTKIKVWNKPRVAVLATGSELTDSEIQAPGKVRNSHSPFFLALLEASGCTAVDLGVVRDDPSEVAAVMAEGLSKADFLLTLGGTSVGRHDVVGPAVQSLGPSLILHGIRMDRGRVTGIAVVRGRPVLIMPGPIQGAMNAFVLFGLPLISHLGGRGRGLEVSYKMGKGWKARKRFQDFTKVVYVKLTTGEDVVAEPVSGETESIKVLAEADGCVVVPEEVRSIRKGTKVSVKMIPGFSFVQ